MPYTALNQQHDLDPLDVHLGRVLRDFRLRVGWSLNDMAGKVGVSHQTIHKYELAQTKISASMLYKFSNIFSISVESFFDGYISVNKNNINQDQESIYLKDKKSIKLLLIEDSPSDEFIIRNILDKSKYKFDIFCIHKGDDAIDYFKNKSRKHHFGKPDIIFLDINLPKESGLSVLRSIKQDRQYRDIPVIVISHSLRKSDMDTAYSNFASGYINKCLQIDSFEKSINSVLTYWVDTVICPQNKYENENGRI